MKVKVTNIIRKLFHLIRNKNYKKMYQKKFENKRLDFIIQTCFTKSSYNSTIYCLTNHGLIKLKFITCSFSIRESSDKVHFVKISISLLSLILLSYERKLLNKIVNQLIKSNLRSLIKNKWQ